MSGLYIQVVMECCHCKERVNGFAGTGMGGRYIPHPPEHWVMVEYRENLFLFCCPRKRCRDKLGYTNPSSTHHGEPRKCKFCGAWLKDHAHGGKCLFEHTCYEPEFP